MKTLWILILSGPIGLTAAPLTWSENSRRTEQEQILLWETHLDAAKAKPPEERLADLWLGLRNMGYRKNQEGHNPEVDGIYDKLQKEMLNIPGHARYFEEKRREARAKCVNLALDTDYEQACARMMETLRHLPSPETVQVLGRLLESDEDAPTDEQAKEYRRLERRGDAVSWQTPHSIGLRTLPYLGIRGIGEPPEYIRTFATEPYTLLRPWWEEVKAGKLAFSFKGQKVEYRFKPDGTWETLPMANPPDDGLKLPAASAQPPSAPSPPPAQPRSSKHLWWLTALGVIAALMAWFAAGKIRKNSRP